MKKRLFATVLTMTLTASLMTGCGSGKTTDSAAPTVAETAKTEGGENSKDARDSSDMAADEADTVADKIGPSGETGAPIGVAIPTKNLQGQNQDGVNMKMELEVAGYEVDLQYASNDVQTRVSRIENTISNGYQVLAIVSIDGGPLGELLGWVKEAGIPIVSYGHLIMNLDAVTYYTTFNNYKVGRKQGERLVEASGLKTATESENIELFTGDLADNNYNFFFGRAMDALQKYIDENRLAVKSGQTAFEQVTTANWDSGKVQSRVGTITTGNYSDGTVLDTVLCSNDSTVLDVENILASSYTETYPVIIGRSCDITSVRNMLSGKQATSVFKDTHTLATQVVRMVDAATQDGEAEINDSSSHDNSTGVTPTCLCELVVVTADNYKETLVDSGYYTEDQIEQISIQKQIPLPIKWQGKTNPRDG